MKVRDSNIELLRMITMLGVVILHYNNPNIGGAFHYVTPFSSNHFILLFLENCFVGSVDMYMFIAGFFLIQSQKRDLKKVILLIVQVIVFSELFYVLAILRGSKVPSVTGIVSNMVPSNYFLILYSTVYIISPFVNLMLRSLTKKRLFQLSLCLIVLFSLYPIFWDVISSISGNTFQGINTHGLYGDQSGYDLINFLLLYILGASYFLLKEEINDWFDDLKAVICTLIGLLALSMWSYLEISNNISNTSWHYNNPLIIIIVISVFKIFNNHKFSSKLVNELAKAAFTCFLINDHFLNFVKISSFVNKNVILMIIHILISAVLCYLFSYIMYKAYSLLQKFMDKYLPNIYLFEK